MTDLSADDILARAVHRALRHLYEPVELRSSPLAAMLGVERQGDIPSVLRRILLEGIQALRPDAKAPPDSNAWRMYQLLQYRFEEQFSQEETAAQLAVSVRQLRRMESAAIRALAELLASQHGVTINEKESESLPEDDVEGSPADELEWLKKTYSHEIVLAEPLIVSALKVGEALLREAAISLRAEIPPDLPAIAGQATTLRQALLNLILAACNARAGGKSPDGAVLNLRAFEDEQAVLIDLWMDGPISLRADTGEYMESARSLVLLSGGTLAGVPGKGGCVFCIRVALRKAEQVNVMVVDDNEDILRLVERCLEGTRYRFFSARSPYQVIPLAEEIEPQVILLDIMLPDVDGWEMLGRLRAHPRLERVPVIITTILPHEQLAVSLGAAGFLRKPVRRQELLALLDQHSSHPGLISH